MTLYDLGTELQAVERAMDAEDLTAEEQQAIVDGWLEACGDQVQTKLDWYAALIRQREAYAETRKAEAARLAQLARSDEAKAAALKARLLWFLQITGRPKVETERFKIAVCANGGKLPVSVPEDPIDLPEQYQRKAVTADADAIRAALECGIEVPGCSLGERGQHLRIR